MLRLTALLLTVSTGFAALVYEVVWQKYLATLLGSHGEATAAVLAIFLGGLSCGYALFGRATRRVLARSRGRGRPPRLLALYAVVEGGIGVYALLFPHLFDVANQLSLLGPVDHDALSFAFDVALSALLIGAPCVLMGGTIPILTLALAGGVERATRVHAWIYGANTLGAFAGALTAGFWLVALLGLDGVVRAMGCLNLVAALGFAALELRAASVAPDFEESAADASVPRFAAWSGVALLAGFSMMALQTTLNRVGALALGSSHYTFAMLVAVFVLCLALGSFAVSALPRIPRALVVWSQWILVVLLVPLYFAVENAGYWAHWVRARLGGLSADYSEYQLTIFLSTLAVLALPIGLSGALLPLLFHALRREARNLGALAGRLYAWNTLGSLLGALLGGYLLLIWLDLHHIFRIAIACLAAGASILSLLVLDRLPRAVPALALFVTLVVTVLMPAWRVDRLTPGTFRTRAPDANVLLGADAFFERRSASDIVFYDDDPTSSVGVDVPRRRPNNIALYVNGKSDGALVGDYPTMALMALIPALFAERNQRCFVIGLGTGVTAGELAALEQTREVVAAEISRAVIAANPLFAAGNLGVSESPKLEIIRGDAYRTLLRSSGRYDVIASEPSNPWVAGVEMLYSREFLQAARARLAPGGVFAQWFHVYESDEEVVSLILRTYASVFPSVSVWFTTGADLLLMGMEQGDRALDVPALEERFRQPDFAAGFARAGIEQFSQLLVHELIPLGTLHAENSEGPIHTLRRPILSDLAARAFFSGRSVVIVPYASRNHEAVAVENSLLRRYAGGVEVLPDEWFEIAARETCAARRDRECATIIARWAIDHPDSKSWRVTLSALRKTARARNSTLAAHRLERLYELYNGLTIPDEDAPPAHVSAQRVTDRFANFYHHVFPFERRVLEEAWNRCNTEECEAGRLRAEKLLWGFSDRAAR